MEIKIKPRTKSDKGGYVMMPLKRNVPKAQSDSWKLTKCPICGADCWERPIPPDAENNIDGKLCTMCALKIGIGTPYRV